MAVIITSDACRKDPVSNDPSDRTNFRRFRDDRLHAESSRNMYSEQLWTTKPEATKCEVSGSVRS